MSSFRTLSLHLNKFRMFGEYELVPLLQEKQKHEHRALLVRYLCTEDYAHYRVLVLGTGQIMLCRRANYR